MQENKKSFNKGENLVTVGERGSCAYIIESGEVEILVDQNGDEVQIGTRGPGSLIGEMAMVDNQPRVATVRALEDCEVFEITRDDFGHRLEEADPIIKMFMRVILTRYRDTLYRTDVSAARPSGVKLEDLENSDEDYAQAVDSIKVASELRHALENDELSLHYQPILNLQTGMLAGYEALMRWNHPEKGNIPPNIFIPVAEESGLIVELSRWGMEEACSAIKLFDQALKDKNDDLFMCVNMSANDFLADGFYDSIDKLLSAKSLKPSKIHLEVTERILMKEPDEARAVLEQCEERGLHISIDDFGTGYSSLSYLHYFPINTLKIDQSFVRNMIEQDRCLELVRSIIALGKNMKMGIVAEGIETQEQASAMKSFGCDFGQGYLFAKPGPLAQVLDLTENWQPFEIK